ncbi:MAG: hypothetical protein EOP00_14020 [Pedobacter sp.]|nr:MAG: hypothetical protein EOP00_14020 [Pedobacter sp.]
MKRILFITQNMERTGSEMVLWHLLNNLDAAKYSVYVFCLKKGALYHSLPSHVQKSVVYKESGSLKNKIWRTLLKVFGVKPLNYQLKDIHQQFKPDYWYVNTLAIPWVYEVAKTINVKVVTHLHELLYAFTFVKRSEFETMLSQSNTVIGCSDMVCEYIKKLGHNDVRLQYSFIDEFNIDVNPEKVEALKKAHGIQADDFVWVISGATTYMKGFDYILGLLDEHKSTNVKFLSKPLITEIYTADPSAHVFDGKIYIYPSHDIESGVAENDNGDHFDMKDFHILSMDSIDGKVTDHGVGLDIKDIAWAGRQLWAPDAAYKDGTYFLYFPVKDKNDVFRIGVATSKNPAGPFKAQPHPIAGSYSIDPAVFTDTDGTSYMYFGGIWGGQLQRWKKDIYNDKGSKTDLQDDSAPAISCKVARLKPNMLEFDGKSGPIQY